MTYSFAVLPLPSKTVLKDELIAMLERDLAMLERAQKETREAATHEQAKPENDKDTRALEQSYLARGQALRVEELGKAVSDLRGLVIRDFLPTQPAALGALVTVAEEEGERTIFLASYGGGSVLAGGQIQVVTPLSPLGRALIGKCAGDDFEVHLGGRVRAIEIAAIR